MKLRAAAAILMIAAGFGAGAAQAQNPARSPGNAANGQALFEGKGNCLNCHRVRDKGQFSGPDLTDVGRTRSLTGIQSSLLDPTAAMRPINRPVHAVTRDGKTINGRRLNEDQYNVQLITDQGRLVSLVKSDLREWTVSTVSPMPSYKSTLTPAELTDLLAYLTSLQG